MRNVSTATAGIAAGFVGILISLILHREWRSKGAVDPFPVALAAVLISLASVIGGFAIAEQQIVSDADYEVQTKSGVLSGVKILRSSSNGFIVYQDNRILFVPSGEVRLISGPVGNEKIEAPSPAFEIIMPDIGSFVSLQLPLLHVSNAPSTSQAPASCRCARTSSGHHGPPPVTAPRWRPGIPRCRVQPWAVW
jgi:hypothetical protein